jgi:hypothetical protein
MSDTEEEMQPEVQTKLANLTPISGSFRVIQGLGVSESTTEKSLSLTVTVFHFQNGLLVSVDAPFPEEHRF